MCWEMKRQNGQTRQDETKTNGSSPFFLLVDIQHTQCPGVRAKSSEIQALCGQKTTTRVYMYVPYEIPVRDTWCELRVPTTSILIIYLLPATRQKTCACVIRNWKQQKTDRIYHVRTAL